MKKLCINFALMATALLISGNAWANYFMPEIEAKPAPEIIEEPMMADGQVFDVIVADNAAKAPLPRKAVAEGDVAKIGEIGYATLADAIAAANATEEGGAVIEVLQNTTLGCVTISKDMTLDLKDKVVTISGYTTNVIFTINAALTIKGYENETQGKIYANFGQLNTTSGKVSSYLLRVASTGSINIESGNIYGCSYVVYSQGAVSIEGEHTTLYGNSAELYVATANIPVTINGPQSGLYINDLKGATYTLNGTVTLGGGTLCPAAKAQFTDANLAEGKSFIKSLSSSVEVYTIGSLSSIAASVGEYMFTSLPTACANSSEANPAKMLKDYSTTSYFYPAASYWLDLNGFTMTVASYGLIASGNITIMDNSDSHTGKIVNNADGWPVIYYNADNVSFTLLGGTLQQFGDTDADGYAPYGINTNGKASPNITISGQYSKIEVPNGNCIAVFGVTANSTVTVTDGATLEGSACILNLGTYTDMNTTMNVSNGAKLRATGLAIYHPGGGYLNISGDETVIQGGTTAIEIRAGELNISGGTITSTFDHFECQPNGSGQTTLGAALAISQHTTKQPITVNISGGHFLGNYAVSQCNPQQNPDEYLDLLNIEVTGGYFWSENGANIISVTENRRLFLKGGVYNLDPKAFTVNGYFSLQNQPELYAGSYAQRYVFKVAQQAITEEETKSDGTIDWAQNTTWNNDIPDYATNVTISKNIEVTTPAEANTITISNGSTLTVKDGGTLIIGNGGIVGATKETFKVKAGGQVLIAPNAENATLYGSVDLLADRAGLKPGKEYTGQGSEMYWQHIAIPTSGAPESITPSVPGKTFFNTWDIMNGWQNVGTAALNASFKGYNLGNFHPYSADGSGSVTYTFVGQLVGNQPDYMVFAREGHSFFGNSYLAPLDVATMFGMLYNQDLEYTLNIYDSQTEMYQPVNEATYSILGIDEIKPLQGFFIYAQKATQAQLDYNSAVFTAYLNNHAVGGQNVTAAPARKMAAKTYDKMAQITIAATTGEKDAIYLFEDANFSKAEDNGFDARNLEHSGLDMSVAGSYADLSVLATDNLEGALLNINTNNAVEYTMTFSHMQGDMTLTDNVTGATIVMQEGATYTFAAQPNAQLNGRFAVNTVRTMPTNTEEVKAAPAAKGIYTMMGQYVGETANWNALPAGVYVVDGVRVAK